MTLLCFSKTFDEHVAYLRQILQTLREHQLFAKESKCELATQSIEFCGFIVDPKGIRTQPDKIKAISDWPIPTTPKHVRSFLCFMWFLSTLHS